MAKFWMALTPALSQVWEREPEFRETDLNDRNFY
jgi:hypothetical protein